MQWARKGTVVGKWTGFIVVLWLAATPAMCLAQGADVLTRMLAEGRNFRVRTRAALALGRSGEIHHVAALERALLRDRHPAVRLAAADALALLGCPNSRNALAAAERDRDARVRRGARAALARLGPPPQPIAKQPVPPVNSDGVDWARVRHALVLGDVRNGSGYLGGDLAHQVRQTMAAQLGGRRDIVVVVPGSLLASEVERRKVPRFRLEASVTAVHRKRVGAMLHVRCDVSVLLLDEPGRSMRSVLRGSATGVEAVANTNTGQERELAHKAVRSATTSALANAWRALHAATAGGAEMAALQAAQR